MARIFGFPLHILEPRTSGVEIGLCLLVVVDIVSKAICFSLIPYRQPNCIVVGWVKDLVFNLMKSFLL